MNSDKVSSASYGIKVDDVLTIAIHERIRILKVAALGARRGPAPEAALLYEDLTPPENRESAEERMHRTPSPERRPDKRERRKIDEFKDGLR